MSHRASAAAARRPPRISGAIVALLCALAGGAPGLPAQVVEHHEDPFGYAIPYPRVRLVHSREPAQEGTTAHLRAFDPFLFYQLGRDLLNRQFELHEGIVGRPGTLDVPLYVGLSDEARRRLSGRGGAARFARDHSASCGLCHSSVYRDPGAGPTIASTGSAGRNSTHFFGAGLVEMIGFEVRARILELYDRDGNGLIDRSEVAAPAPVRIAPAPGAPAVDYGDLRPGDDGVPRLNSVFRLWYVDAAGRVLPDAFGLDDERVAAFGFVMQPFGWGRGRIKVDGHSVSQGGEATTLREFYTVAADFHMGLQAHDPTQRGGDPAGRGFGGLAGVSLSGAQQFAFGGAVDPGERLTATGLSLDDPDRDGHPAELSEGDVDSLEFYLLHTPPPAVLATPWSESGREVLLEIGCTRCHVEDWALSPRDPGRGTSGDRRLFHLEVTAPIEAGVARLAGRLVPLQETLPSGERVPAGGGFRVERIYSDFRHWDIGERFHERRFDGSLQREHRTAPLWGAGTSAPYGHGGGFLSLHDVIAAHGGAAATEGRAYLALDAERRERLLDYLKSLVLYSTDELPADLDGDGLVAEAFRVGEQEVGYERFNAHFLFRHPPRWEHIARVVVPNGRQIPVGLITNASEAFALDLAFRRDTDGDGFPDAVDPLPTQKGITHAPDSP